MARDLIPPPSPAGRPTAHDGTPNLIELPPEPSRLAPAPVVGPPPGPSEFRNRFGFLLGGLAGVFIAAALAAAVVIANSGNGNDDAGLYPNWSHWQPTDTTIEGGAQQIADHVGVEYTHPDGEQLVKIDRLDLTGARVLVRPARGAIVDIQGTTVVYRLDGLGPNHSIIGGTPSATRLKVIHREALELALYTFRYLPDAESVITVLPPSPPTEKEQQAAAAAAAAAATGQPATPTPAKPLPVLFYRPGDLKSQLQVPLVQTLAPTAPSTDAYAGPEADTVDTLTLSNRFVLAENSPGQILLTRPTTG
jgi:hypothetical protein